MNNIELVLWLLSLVVCFGIISHKAGNKRTIMLCMAVFAFAAFILMYKATQYDITDSEKYLHKFVALKDMKSIYPDALYQYRITLLVTGLETLLFRLLGINTLLSSNTLEQWALATHVFLSFILLVVIVKLAFYCFLKNKETRDEEAVFFTAMSAILICCPVLLLELRTYNYDSFSMTLGIIALELAVVAIKDNNPNWLRAGVITATLAAFEKLMASPVLILCLVLSGILECEQFHSAKHVGKVVKGVFVGLFIYLFTAILLQIGIEWIIVREPGDSIDFVSIVYPLCSSFDVLLGNLGYSDMKRELLLFILAVCVLLVLSVVGRLLIQVVRTRGEIIKIIPVMNAVALMAICAVGMISTYVVKMRIYPYDSFAAGESRICPSFNTVYYHYGAATALGQYFFHFCNAMANMMNKITSGHLCLILLYGAAALKKGAKIWDIQELLPHLGISLGILMCILYAVAGVPSDSRYKSLYIAVLLIGCVTAVFRWIKIDRVPGKKKMIILALCVLSMAEIVIYAPNEIPFKPIWNINCSKYPRQGVWDAGEPMQWGIQNMLVGERIKRWADQEGIDYSDITIWCDYGGPGLKIRE